MQLRILNPAREKLQHETWHLRITIQTLLFSYLWYFIALQEVQLPFETIESSTIQVH